MRRLDIVLWLLLVWLLSACSSPRSWVYAPEARQSRSPVVSASLVVPPFIDRRSNENTNAVFLYLIPLMPFGYQSMSVPESTSLHVSSGLWQTRPADDFARAIAQEIDAARIFSEAFTDSRSSSGEFVLSGEIRSMQFDAKMLSYCLSVYGPLLWFIGFPASHTSNELELQLTLTRRDGGSPLWRYTIRGSDSQTGWLYAMGTDFMYDRLLKAAIPAALSSLEGAMRGVVATQ